MVGFTRRLFYKHSYFIMEITLHAYYGVEVGLTNYAYSIVDRQLNMYYQIFHQLYSSC